ncbi:thioesterase II family protein [Streptomyces iconiensis]|uniref:Alpha/beta fold hydrolase n=1 Tax=Streptomyces iconiensis TaxID=1384038 RepID=A0ABT6ZYR7_9ACTN|nr:alpha/beta fold hydrolase [Streptomyces iconiensis]MDJ1134222.1 alpha/beta fold hydrolase [Streptomyces iconiensis]
MNPTQLPGPAGEWLRPLHTPAGAPLRLICFPHAGGGASLFRAWVPSMPDDCALWAVQYPGREDRITERHCDSVPQLARRIAYALQWAMDTPYALFGHSMGAIVAYETAREVDKLGLTSPLRLIASGSPPPDQAAAACRAERDAASPPPASAQEAERPVTATALETDTDLLARYGPDPGAVPTEVPLTVLRHDDDPDLDTGTARGWAAVTKASCRLRTLPGDHFTCVTDPERTIEETMSALTTAHLSDTRRTA